MANFIQSLFESEHFTLYLSIILVILVILFFIVLFFGKKDKKLQETQKLLKFTDGFKEEETKEKLEVAPEVSTNTEVPEVTPDVSVAPEATMGPDINAGVVNEEALVTPDILTPPITVPEESLNPGEKDLEKTIVLPVIEENKPTLIPKDNRPVEMIVFNPNDNPDVALENEVEPIEPKEEVSASDEIDTPNLHFDELSDALEKDLTDLENIKKEFNDIELPTIEEPKEVVKPKKAPPVFSSVFAPKIDIAAEEDADADLDLPTLRTDEKKETSETPTEEVKEENNELPSFSFESINGETYNLNDK